MKKTGAFFTFIALIVITALSGCVGVPVWQPVSIKIDGNLATIVAGETLNFRASGQYIIWDVSSSSDGSQPAADGTFITQRGLLTAAIDESALFLYVTATSAKNGRSDTKRIKVVTVDAVNIIHAHESVAAGRSSQFVARVTGNNYPDHAVIWRVSSNADGTGAVAFGTGINENGLLRVSANERAGVLYVFAISILDLRVFGSTYIIVNPVYVVHHSSPPTVFFYPVAPRPNPPHNHPHSNPSVNAPHNNPHPNPPVNSPNNNPPSKPHGDAPNNRPHSDIPANNPDTRPHSNPGDIPNNRPHSNPQEDIPNNRPHSNPQGNTPHNNPRLDPPANTPSNPPRSNPPVATPANNSRPNSPTSTPANNSRSNPQVDNPNNSRSNPPVNTPANNSRPNPPANTPNNRYIDPLEDIPPNNSRSNPPVNTPTNNSRSNPAVNTPTNNPRSNPAANTPPQETTPSGRQPRR